jgi:hypothetical protein
LYSIEIPLHKENWMRESTLLRSNAYIFSGLGPLKGVQLYIFFMPFYSSLQNLSFDMSHAILHFNTILNHFIGPRPSKRETTLKFLMPFYSSLKILSFDVSYAILALKEFLIIFWDLSPPEWEPN